MTLTCLFFGLLFILSGTLFACGHGHTHLAAWKKMSSAEQAAIRIGPLCRNIGGMICLSGGILLLKGLWPGFSHQAFLLCMAAWLIAAALDVRFIETSGRYEHH